MLKPDRAGWDGMEPERMRAGRGKWEVMAGPGIARGRLSRWMRDEATRQKRGRGGWQGSSAVMDELRRRTWR